MTSPEHSEFHLAVRRTARIAQRGRPDPGTREIWIVCHGYGQLAALFIRHFAPLDDGTRWILAPEALSRFYHEMPDAARHLGAPIGERRVGAAWLTREDREAEIEDAHHYLDAVRDHAAERVDLAQARLVVLGFSQGVATVSRWLAARDVAADRLICWAGTLPNDLPDARGARALSASRATLVYGNEDQWVAPGVVEAQRDRFVRLGVPVDVVGFDGGHRMDARTLVQVSAS